MSHYVRRKEAIVSAKNEVYKRMCNECKVDLVVPKSYEDHVFNLVVNVSSFKEGREKKDYLLHSELGEK